jgi:hypothetical protein
MSIFKSAAILALALTFVGAAPAFAHKSGTEWLVMMEKLQKQREDAYAQERKAPKVTPQLNTTPSVRRPYGGVRGNTW